MSQSRILRLCSVQLYGIFRNDITDSSTILDLGLRELFLTVFLFTTTISIRPHLVAGVVGKIKLENKYKMFTGHTKPLR